MNNLNMLLGSSIKIFCQGDELFRSCDLVDIEYRSDGQPLALVIEEIPGRAVLIPWHAVLEIKHA